MSVFICVCLCWRESGLLANIVDFTHTHIAPHCARRKTHKNKKGLIGGDAIFSKK